MGTVTTLIGSRHPHPPQFAHLHVSSWKLSFVLFRVKDEIDPIDIIFFLFRLLVIEWVESFQFPNATHPGAGGRGGVGREGVDISAVGSLLCTPIQWQKVSRKIPTLRLLAPRNFTFVTLQPHRHSSTFLSPGDGDGSYSDRSQRRFSTRILGHVPYPYKIESWFVWIPIVRRIADWLIGSSSNVGVRQLCPACFFGGNIDFFSTSGSKSLPTVLACFLQLKEFHRQNFGSWIEWNFTNWSFSIST